MFLINISLFNLCFTKLLPASVQVLTRGVLLAWGSPKSPCRAWAGQVSRTGESEAFQWTSKMQFYELNSLSISVQGAGRVTLLRCWNLRNSQRLGSSNENVFFFFTSWTINKSECFHPGSQVKSQIFLSGLGLMNYWLGRVLSSCLRAAESTSLISSDKSAHDKLLGIYRELMEKLFPSGNVNDLNSSTDCV